MSKSRKPKAQFKEEKDGTVQKLKDTIRRLQSDNRKLKSELATFEAAFEKNIQFLKGKTKDLTLKELIDGAKKEQSLIQIEDTVKKNWECKTCNEGNLKLIKIPRQDGMFYIRKCDNPRCKYSTRLKRFSDEVQES